MLVSFNSVRARPRVVLLSLLLFSFLSWSLWVGGRRRPRVLDAATLRARFPLTWNHVHSFNGTGGAWYIPPEWIGRDQHPPRTILEAARLASDAASSHRGRQVALSKIPLIVHQTSRSARMDTWKADVLPWVERWLRHAVEPEGASPMAYLFWDDEGILAFMREREPDLVDDFDAMFTPVERADIFRVLACQYYGGVYADVDTEPLRHPADWIHPSDVSRWTDDVTGTSYGMVMPPSDFPDALPSNTQPVSLVWGLEADTDPDLDTYWRMGYSYPVQVTQWALASAPRHPALAQFMTNLRAHVAASKSATDKATEDLDPLTRTGPAAVTLATMTWLEAEVGFRWNALTGLKDGGKSKLVSDVLVLPITGFSPGRGKYGNMGSKPVTDPDARLHHHALGSWRHFDLVVEYGKFCRTMFGLCKDWSKVPA
ncbi:hypothetical protein RJ55_04318 [Drechmeria coniospora]|nr:hypothetical protein RJ55_04318 [Drechmeria coniospora]